MNSHEKIIVIGAGLVGSLFAIMLKKKGLNVSLYEKRPDMRKETLDGGRSINLVVTSRGINGLQKVDLWQKVQKITIPVTGRMMHSKTGELTYQPYGRNDSECNYSVSRSELNKFLMDEFEALGGSIHFNYTLKSIDVEKNIMLFENNEELAFDRIFGADGGGSIVREEMKKLLGDNLQEDKIPLGASYKEMHMPAKEGRYPIEKNALHIWPRGAEMLMALPNLDGSFTMTLYMPDDKFSEINNEEKVCKYFQDNYEDSIEFMPRFSSEYQSNPTGKLTTLKCSPWIYKDKICLIGDAAHAIVPFYGQGMNAGFEDCTTLIKLMNSQENWQQVFKQYNALQKPNGDAIADLAIENFNIMSAKVADKKYLLKKQIEHLLENEFPNLFRSTYGMVTYTLQPYSSIVDIGRYQTEILDELSHEITDIDQLNLTKAKELLETRLSKQYSIYNIDISRFTS